MSSEPTEQTASGTTTPESALSGSTSSINDNNNSNNSTSSPTTSSSNNMVATTAVATTAVTSTSCASAPIPTSNVSPSSNTTPSSSTTPSSISSLSSSAGSTTSSASNSNENQKEKTAVSSGGSTGSTSSSSEATGTTTTAATTSHTSVASAPPSTTAAGSVSSSMHNATPSSAATAGTAASAGDATFSANTPHTIHVLNGSQASNGYEITAQNGHLAMNGEGIPNGVIMDATALAGATFVPQGIQHYHRHGIAMAHGPAPPMAAPGATPVNNRVSPPGVGGAGLYRPMSNHRGHSPHRYSPNTPHSRGNSPHNQSTSAAGPGASPQQQQHVVHVVVNPGETFTVCIGDQTQHIPGKRFWCLFSERNILDQVLEVSCQKLKLSGREWSPVLLQLSGPGNLSFSLSF